MKVDPKAVKVLGKAVLSFLKIPFEEVAFYFVTEEEIADLHDKFFEDPTSTDCISFPLDEKHLGEVFICPAVAKAYAQKHKGDPYKETALYMVHGLLHLIGYDDQIPKAKEAMRKKEKSCMRHLERLQITLR